MTWLLSLLPAPWLAALKAVPWRLVGFCIAGLLAAWLWIVVSHWHEDSLTLPKVRAQAARDVADARAAVETMKVQYKAAQAASAGYQRDLQDIRNRPVPTGPVRLCVPARPRVSAAGSPASGLGPATALAGVVPGPTGSDFEEGPDIRPDLNALILRCEDVSSQVRGLQAFAPPATP